MHPFHSFESKSMRILTVWGVRNRISSSKASNPDPPRGSCLRRSLVRPHTIFYRPSTSKLIDSPALCHYLIVETVHDINYSCLKSWKFSDTGKKSCEKLVTRFRQIIQNHENISPYKIAKLSVVTFSHNKVLHKLNNLQNTQHTDIVLVPFKMLLTASNRCFFWFKIPSK